jgi:hypothetical protein
MDKEWQGPIYGADPKGESFKKVKNIWPALAGYIFFEDL